MIVYYKAIYQDKGEDGPYTFHTYKNLGYEECCTKITTAINDDFLSFKKDSGSEPDGFGLVTTDWQYFQIDYCPFCGEKIELVEKERSRLVKTTMSVTKTYDTTVWDEVPLPPMIKQQDTIVVNQEHVL